MRIKQLSVFLENKVGVINALTETLGRNNINMRAFSVAEGMEFGIMRLIVDDPGRAVEVLSSEGFTVSVTEVLSLSLPNVAGSLASLLDLLARGEVFIQYMYAFSEGDVASTVIKPNDIDRCAEILDAEIEGLKAKNQLYSL